MAERCFDTQPPIDFNKIKGVFGNLEFVRNFMESLAIDKHFLENAYRLGDWVLIGDIAHRIRGCALYFGAAFVEEACQELESNLVDLNHQNREDLYHKAISAIVVLEDYINSYLSSKVD